MAVPVTTSLGGSHWETFNDSILCGTNGGAAMFIVAGSDILGGRIVAGVEFTFIEASVLATCNKVWCGF